MSWWVTDYLNYQGPAFLVSWIVWVLGSIILHELSHGWAAIRCGDTTPIETGHMTWNPMVHMGGMSLLMFAMAGIAWGQMPVNPSRFRRRKDDAFVAFAGPGMNLALALSSFVLGSLWIAYAGSLVPEQAFVNLAQFFFLGTMLNLVLMLFNLLPIPPLDGATILATYSDGFRRLRAHPNFAGTAMILFILVFFRLSGPLWALCRGITDAAFEWATSIL